MDTKVACANPKCGAYKVVKTVTSAMILGADPKVCPQCGGHMKVVERVNTSHKGLRKSPGKRDLGKRMGKR